MKFTKKIMYFFLIFFSKISSIQYNSIIELCFRIEKESYEEEISENLNQQSCMIQKISPIVNFENEPSFSDGLNMYIKNEPIKSNNEITYCLSKKILNKNIKGVPGVFSFYKGYSNLSDNEGISIFPSFQNKNSLKIIVTKKIFPAIFSKKTPSYFMIPEDEPSRWYICEGYEENNSYFWKIKNLEPRKNEKIKDDFLIIIGDPELLSFDTDPQISSFSGNIIVPTIFLKKNFKRGIYAINTFNELKYFSPQILKMAKTDSTQYAKLIKL